MSIIIKTCFISLHLHFFRVNMTNATYVLIITDFFFLKKSHYCLWNIILIDKCGFGKWQILTISAAFFLVSETKWTSVEYFYLINKGEKIKIRNKFLDFPCP